MLNNFNLKPVNLARKHEVGLRTAHVPPFTHTLEVK